MKLHGFDISLDQCPPKAWLPANIKFDTWDIFTEPPPSLAGTFDIVHVRLITLVIKNGNPSQVIANLRKLLSKLHPSPGTSLHVFGYPYLTLVMKSLVAICNGMK